MLTASAIGYAAGTWVPSRFTAPLAAVGLFALQGLGEGLPGSMGHLSPIRWSYGSV